MAERYNPRLDNIINSSSAPRHQKNRQMGHAPVPYSQPSALTALQNYGDRVGQRNRAAMVNNRPAHSNPYGNLAALGNNLTRGASDVSGARDISDGIQKGDPASIAEGILWGMAGAAPLLKNSAKGVMSFAEPFFSGDTLFDDGIAAILQGAKYSAKKLTPGATAGAAGAATMTPSESDAGGVKRAVEAFADAMLDKRQLIPKKKGDGENLRALRQINEASELEGWPPTIKNTAQNLAIEGNMSTELIASIARTMKELPNE